MFFLRSAMPCCGIAYDPDVAFLLAAEPADLPVHTANARSLSQKRTVVQIILAQQPTIKLLIRPLFLNGLQCSMSVMSGMACAATGCRQRPAAWQQTHTALAAAVQ
ncbi:hypothetical protein LJR296_000465 [Cupriavidus necator]|jgi:hypothetical protein|uniref:hypothetical protein n=1 Tax=Cupriavidus necator TaxID=106590 RepID=UPI003ECD32A1